MHLRNGISVLNKQTHSMFYSGYKPPGCVFNSSGTWSKAFLKAYVRASREQLRGYSKGEVSPTGPMYHCHCCFSSESGVLPLLCCMILKFLKSSDVVLSLLTAWNHWNSLQKRDCKVIISECVPSYLWCLWTFVAYLKCHYCLSCEIVYFATFYTIINTFVWFNSVLCTRPRLRY